MLALSSAALAGERCPAEQASNVQIGGQRYAVEVAATSATRERGLSGHPPLARNAGMWFVLEEVGQTGFWMRGMGFSLDMVWVGPERRVVGVDTLPVCRNDPCPITYPPVPAAYVLEVAAGRFAGRVGDRVAWTCGEGPVPLDAP